MHPKSDRTNRNLPKLTYSYHKSPLLLFSPNKIPSEHNQPHPIKKSQSPDRFKLKILLTKQSLAQKLALNKNLLNISMFNMSERNSVTRARKQKKEKKLFEIIKCQKKYTKEEKEKWFVENKKYNPFFFRETAQEISDRYVHGARKRNDDIIHQCAYHYQSTKCIDGCFQMSRINSCLTYNHKSQVIYLIGGLSPQIGHQLHFHQFDSCRKLWTPIQSQDNNAPRFNLSQHCVVSYKNLLYIIGGIAIFPSSQQINKNERYNIPFISCYNTQRRKWKRINWNIYLRAHACCSFGHFLMIDGGIDQYFKYNSKTYVLDLQLDYAPILLSDPNLKLAFHKICSTDQVDQSIKSDLKAQGLYCFGGKFKNGSVNSDIFFCEIDPRLNDKMKKMQWKVVNVQGKCPQGRYSHSMDVLNVKSLSFQKRAYILIVGGKNASDQVLNDVWAFDLFMTQWYEISLPENSTLVSRGICQHSSTATQNTLYVFGGVNNSLNCSTEFWSLNFCKKSRKGRLIVKKYLSGNKQNPTKKYIQQYNTNQ